MSMVLVIYVMYSYKEKVTMDTFFVDWVQEQMKSKGWGLMDLHRASGLDAGGLSYLLAGKRAPGLKTCKSLARQPD